MGRVLCGSSAEVDSFSGITKPADACFVQFMLINIACFIWNKKEKRKKKKLFIIHQEYNPELFLLLLKLCAHARGRRMWEREMQASARPVPSCLLVLLDLSISMPCQIQQAVYGWQLLAVHCLCSVEAPLSWSARIRMCPTWAWGRGSVSAALSLSVCQGWYSPGLRWSALEEG